MGVSEYKIITTVDDENEIIRLINGHLSYGRSLQGGISIATSMGNIFHSQAIIRTTEVDKKEANSD